jgi:hypothetical protein
MDGVLDRACKALNEPFGALWCKARAVAVASDKAPRQGRKIRLDRNRSPL